MITGRTVRRGLIAECERQRLFGKSRIVAGTKQAVEARVVGRARGGLRKPINLIPRLRVGMTRRNVEHGSPGRAAERFGIGEVSRKAPARFLDHRRVVEIAESVEDFAAEHPLVVSLSRSRVPGHAGKDQVQSAARESPISGSPRQPLVVVVDVRQFFPQNPQHYGIGAGVGLAGQLQEVAQRNQARLAKRKTVVEQAKLVIRRERCEPFRQGRPQRRLVSGTEIAGPAGIDDRAAGVRAGQ